jgi:hypothetical protein
MKHLNPEKMRIMLKTYASRMAAGAVISAALTGGSLGLTTTAASACPNPNCVRGVPPVAARAMECSEPKCLSGTRPAAAPRPGAAALAAAAAGLAGVSGASTAVTVVQAAGDCQPLQCGANHNQVLV